MTNEEAVEKIEKQISYIMPQSVAYRDGHIKALRMAIQALEQADADGCEGCKYQGKDEFEQPCLICKRSKMDYWRSNNEMDKC